MQDLKLVDRLWLSLLQAINPEHKKIPKRCTAIGIKQNHLNNIVYMDCRRKRS